MAKNKIRALLDQASQSDVFYCIENKTTFAEAQAAFRAGKNYFTYSKLLLEKFYQ